MARIRHIAIIAHDTEKVAAFYKNAFGMEEALRQDYKGNPCIFLSDGYMNLALLAILDRPEGIYHFGFQVDDVAQALETALSAGGTPPHRELPKDRQAETFVTDPVGIKVDLSRGWEVVGPKPPTSRETVEV